MFSVGFLGVVSGVAYLIVKSQHNHTHARVFNQHPPHRIQHNVAAGAHFYSEPADMELERLVTELSPRW